MEIEFYGAAGCVTGSCHILHVNGKKVLLDCGLYQGKDEKEIGNDGFNFNPKEIDYVILSHAHIDHSGRIPLLYKKGFKGKIICTEATRDLCSVMLLDSGHIQEMEVEWKNRKRKRQGARPLEPLYTSAIASLSMYLFETISYDKITEIFDGFKVRFKDAGHLLGSAFVELFIKEDDRDEIKVVYTGDVGNKNIPIIRDPSKIDYADYLIMETTYGDRIHDTMNDQINQLANIIKETFARGGNVIIPSFAVGRAQEILYELDKYIENNEFYDLKVFLDSPLGAESTKIFERHIDCFDDETRNKFENGNNPLDFKGLVFTNSLEDSLQINKIATGAVVISASGMCDAGRIKHHLKHNLWRNECSIVFVGYQAEGTLGSAILNGARKVKLFGEEIAVNAHIYSLQGLSGHADRNGLFQWVKAFSRKPNKIFLVHGESKAEESFKKLLDDNGYDSKIVKIGEIANINDGTYMKRESRNTSLKNQLIKYLDSLDDIDEVSRELIILKIKDIIKNSWIKKCVIKNLESEEIDIIFKFKSWKRQIVVL